MQGAATRASGASYRGVISSVTDFLPGRTLGAVLSLKPDSRHPRVRSALPGILFLQEGRVATLGLVSLILEV